MGFEYKRFYLSGGVSMLVIFSLIAGFVEYYDGYEDIVYCEETCWVEFCMKNGRKNLDFYNKEELPLTFDPADSITNVKFYKKDGRYKKGYREIDFIKPYSKNRKYVFRIPAYLRQCYAMEITKEASASVKWTFAGLDPWLIGTSEGNLTYDVNECYDNISLGGCFAINWSKAYNQINWSDNVTIQSGNYSWNFTELNISPIDVWLFNFTNNGTSNITVKIILNTSNPSVWQVFYNNSVNVSNSSFVSLINLTNGSSAFINFTLNLYNISQTYVNWTLNKSTAEFSFNYTINITEY